MAKSKINYKILAYSLLISFLPALIGGIFTFPAINTWYTSLEKTPVTPPNWLFSPMWTTLYTLMGVSLYFVWIKGIKTSQSKLAVALFGIQLFLNALWSILFFGMRELLFGLVEIIFLWYFILITIIEFREIDKKAGYIMIPYLAWVTIAAILNLSVVWLNY